MTRLIVIFISLIAISLILAGQSSAKIDPKAVVAMWLFDEGDGKVAKDSSGNGHDGGFIGKPKWVKGHLGQALEFDGASACVKISPGLSNVENITVVVWVYNADNWGTTRSEIWCGSDTYGDYLLLRGDERGEWHAGEAIWHWYDGGSWGALPSGPLKAKTWYHLAGSYDGKNLKLYLNGKLVDSKATSVSTNNSMDTCIGCHPTPTNYWKGIIDEVAVFDIALTEEEIKSIITYGLENMNPVSLSGKLETAWGKIKNQY